MPAKRAAAKATKAVKAVSKKAEETTKTLTKGHGKDKEEDMVVDETTDLKKEIKVSFIT